jgi:hypothetical protein
LIAIRNLRKPRNWASSHSDFCAFEFASHTGRDLITISLVKSLSACLVGELPQPGHGLEIRASSHDRHHAADLRVGFDAQGHAAVENPNEMQRTLGISSVLNAAFVSAVGTPAPSAEKVSIDVVRESPFVFIGKMNQQCIWGDSAVVSFHKLAPLRQSQRLLSTFEIVPR